MLQIFTLYPISYLSDKEEKLLEPVHEISNNVAFWH